MERLPYIDEHAMAVGAPRERVWAALVRSMRRQMGSGRGLAAVLGCEPARGTAAFEGREGETLPGFRVAEAEPGRLLVLEGRHRFSRYRLTFVLEDGRLLARTHAAFPGIHGRLYRAAVIGTGAHRLATRHILRQVAARV